MSNRQIAQSVKDGRRISVRVEGEVITGYVGGMDDYHWLIVAPTDDGGVTTTLIHKSAPLVHLHPESTYAEESGLAAMEQIIAPFRGMVMRTYFGANAAAEE